MGKTYRKARSERPNKIKRRWKEFRVTDARTKRKIIKELEDYEQAKEMSKVQDQVTHQNI
jgi:hypothetical protein